MMNSATSDDHADAGWPKRKVFLDDGVVDDGALVSSAVEWDRAVGLRLNNAVVLAAHHLDKISATSGLRDSFVFAMTGEVPEIADKMVCYVHTFVPKRHLEECSKITVEQLAELVVKFAPDKGDGSIEILNVGRDWDKLGNFVPCLSYGCRSMSYNPPETCCIGSGYMYSRSVVKMQFKRDMSIEQAIDVALHAIYSAAFFGRKKGQAVEAVDVCVATAETIYIRHYDVEYLHKTYGPMVQARITEIREDAKLFREKEL